jgi:hypothetical protein
MRKDTVVHDTTEANPAISTFYRDCRREPEAHRDERIEPMLRAAKPSGKRNLVVFGAVLVTDKMNERQS